MRAVGGSGTSLRGRHYGSDVIYSILKRDLHDDGSADFSAGANGEYRRRCPLSRLCTLRPDWGWNRGRNVLLAAIIGTRQRKLEQICSTISTASDWMGEHNSDKIDNSDRRRT